MHALIPCILQEDQDSRIIPCIVHEDQESRIKTWVNHAQVVVELLRLILAMNSKNLGMERVSTNLVLTPPLKPNLGEY